jgi:DNA polymerase-3 subunit alpha
MNQNIPYVNLHVHTNIGSIGDALGMPEDIVQYVLSQNGSAVAFTDHGNMNAVPYIFAIQQDLLKKEKTFKCIYGIEAYYIDSLRAWEDLYDQYRERVQKKEKQQEQDPLEGVEDIGEHKKRKSPVNRRSHLLLLAQNLEGLHNLYTLVSKSHSDKYFYRYPRIDYELLAQHSKGVLCSSACLNGRLAECYFENQDKGEEAVVRCMKIEAQRFLDIFHDRFFFELQWNAFSEQHAINRCLIRTAIELGCQEQLISSSDAHYPRPDLWLSREMYKRLSRISNKKESAKPLPLTPQEVGFEAYPRSGQQMWEAYKYYAAGGIYDDKIVLSSLFKTYDIAQNMIEDFKLETDIRFPDFIVPPGYTDNERLAELAHQGLLLRHHDTKQDYLTRLAYELEVVKKRKFAKYFLLVHEIVEKAKTLGLTGPARGSASGSLLSYLLGITQVDPVRFNLHFERFMDPESESFPDIDWDVQAPMELKELLAKEWKKQHNVDVVPISNFSTLQLRSLIKDIAKFYDIPFIEVNAVTGVMMQEATPLAKEQHGIKAGVYVPTFDEVLEFSVSLQKFLKKYPKVAEHIAALKGAIRGTSRHAAGILVEENLEARMPLIRSGGVIQTPWAEGQKIRNLEPMGFLKMDALGLTTLSIIHNTIKRILQNHYNNSNPSLDDVWNYYNEYLHPDTLDLDDQEVYQHVYHKGHFAGIFQASEKGMQALIKAAKPTNINELSTLNAIYRPGPLGAGVDAKYLAIRNGELHIDHPHPLVTKVLARTAGVCCYDEQIAELAHVLGKDLSLAEGNRLRKLLIKKGLRNVEQKKAALKRKFVAGCQEKDLSDQTINQLWEEFELHTKYSFCYNHCLSYSLISYQCAWLLTHYSAEWACAVLDNASEETKESDISAVRALGFTIEGLDINHSGTLWNISKDSKSLIPPLTLIKGLGEKAVEQIMQHRPFKTLEELLFNEKIAYAKLNKKALDVLLRSQALNSLIDDRFSGLRHAYSAIVVDRARIIKDFQANIERYRPEGDFSEAEKVDYLVSLTGIFPFHIILPEQMLKALVKHKIPPISAWDDAIGMAYFVPREVLIKQTKNGRTYWVVITTDPSGAQQRVKVWSIHSGDKLYLNRVYAAKLNYDSKWGLSCPGVYCLKLLG